MAFEDRNPKLLIVTPEQKHAIRVAVNITSEEALQRDVDAVLEWYKKQQHLPRIELGRNVIENIIIARKGSVEQTKQKIDMMFTIRTLVPELAAPRDIRHPMIQKCSTAMHMAPLPRLNHDNTRVCIYKYTKAVDKYELGEILNHFFMIVEYRLVCDYSAGDRILVDFENRSLAHIGKEPPNMIKNFELFIQKAYGVRLFGIHIINAPNFINTIVSLIKSVLSEKLGSRLFVHDNYDDLYKYVDKDILPKEYGGKEKPLMDIVDDWNDEMDKDEIRNYLLEQEKYHSDESKRIGVKLDEEMMGISGTFKNLIVD